MTTPFGAVLREILAERGLRQARVADMADIDHAHLSRMLSGQRPATRDIVVRIADGCGLTAEESLRLFCAAGFVPEGHESMMLDPELQEAAATLHDEAIPLVYRQNLRRQISALVGIARQTAA